MSATLNIASILSETPVPAAGLPAWFTERQAAAWKQFQATPAPSRKDETWRFSSLKQLDFSQYQLAMPSAMAAQALEQETQLEDCAARLVFVNEQLVDESKHLPQGVICMPLIEAIQSHSELVREHFMRDETRLGSAKFTALHAARLSSGVFVYVPDGVEVAGVIEISHWLEGEFSSIFPHTLVVTGKNAKVKVVDRFQSLDDRAGLCLAVNDLVIGEGAKLDYVALQDLNEASQFLQVNATKVGRDGDATNFVLNIGSRWARTESLSHLNGRGANSDMLSVSIASGDQEYDQRTFQHHAVDHTTSDLLFKNTLYDRTRTVFSGLIFVDEGAHYTDAYQTCRNLLMSEQVEANSMPGLEINADQVKCSHGSTSAQISDEEIYYLQTRGISAPQARQLIAEGFSNEAIARLKDESLEALVFAWVARKFQRIIAAH